jgi:AmmeMemoRadiSam system protein A
VVAAETRHSTLAPSTLRLNLSLEAPPMKELAQSDRRQLLDLARAAIEAAARRDPKPALDPATLTPGLLAPAAAFVTIHEHGELRGCIGMMRFDVPLWENVREAAAAAALDDPRFLPIAESELPALELEVSVLDPLVELRDPAEFVAGRHGIVVERDGRRALLLPQVAAEMGWDAEQMLEAVCHKAHLPGQAWRDAATRLHVFESTAYLERGPTEPATEPASR